MGQIDLYAQKIVDFFIENATPEFIIKFIVIYFFIVWISLIVWVIKDVSIRSNSILFQIFCVLIILVWTPFSIFLYLLIRPRRTLYDLYFEDIEEDLDIFYEIVDEIKNERKQDEKKIIKNFVSWEKEIGNFKKDNLIKKSLIPNEEEKIEKVDIEITEVLSVWLEKEKENKNEEEEK